MPLPHRMAPKGPLVEYLDFMRTLAAERGDRSFSERVEAEEREIRAALLSPAGVKIRELFEKALIDTALPATSDFGALAVRNGQALIGHDLRRIVANEVERTEDTAGAGGGGRRRRVVGPRA